MPQSQRKQHNSGNRRRQPAAKNGELRLIGGQWKRSRISFPLLEGVRPTPSRVRETLFNWLAADIRGSYCLDMFAGSGALGFEALSRGAAHVWMVDKEPMVCSNLRQISRQLEATDADIIQADALSLDSFSSLIEPAPTIIFCDPPFHRNLLPGLIVKLEQSGWILDGTQIYIETEASLKTLDVPEEWSLHREKKAGDVIYRLYQITL